MERCLGSSSALKPSFSKACSWERFELVCSRGGEPLCKMASLSVSSRRLPETVPDAFVLSTLQAPFSKGRAAMEHAGSFPGAAC